VAAWARHEDGVLKVEGTVVSPDGRLVLNEAAEGDPGRAVALGVEVANGLLARGAADVMASAEAGD
jgi:porphobilinogen deaminase